MKLQNIPRGIELCLENGKRLLDDARFLQENHRFRSSIPLYVLAYEEIGKAIFLYGHLSDKKDVEDSEFRSLTKGGSHLPKILIDYDEVLDRLEKMTEKEFEATRLWAKRNGKEWWEVDRATAIKLHKRGYDIIERLNDTKKAFLYVDYAYGKWLTQREFRDEMLEAVCEYLYQEVLRPYYMIKLDMFLYSIGLTKKMPLDKEQEQKMLANENTMKLNEVFRKYKDAEFKKKRALAEAVIRSIDTAEGMSENLLQNPSMI